MTPRLSLLCQLSQHGNDLHGKIVRPMQQQASHGPLQFASSLPLIVFESDPSKLDSDSQFVFMLHGNNPKSNPHTRFPPIDSEVSNGDLKFH